MFAVFEYAGITLCLSIFLCCSTNHRARPAEKRMLLDLVV